MYRFTFDKATGKWGVVNENGDIILFAQTREQAQQIAEDLNKA